MDTRVAVHALAALAQDRRLEIFRLLVQAGPEGLAAGEIAGRVGLPASTLSFHVKALSQAGLIGARPRSRHIYYSANFDAMNELMTLALRCDLTRVITFMLGNGGSYRSFDFIGAVGAHHELSHHGGDPINLDKLTTIGRWEVERFADLVARMAADVDLDGNRLIDRTLIYLSSEISDGDRHNHDDLPTLLAGSGCGAHTPGRHVVYPETPVADLFSAFRVAAGGPDGPFGQDGVGALGGLVA